MYISIEKKKLGNSLISPNGFVYKSSLIPYIKNHVLYIWQFFVSLSLYLILLHWLWPPIQCWIIRVVRILSHPSIRDSAYYIWGPLQAFERQVSGWGSSLPSIVSRASYHAWDLNINNVCILLRWSCSLPPLTS